MNMPPKNAPMYDVPAGTRPSQCRGSNCNATIYWITRPNGKKMPVDCEVEGGWKPSESPDPDQGDLLGEPNVPRDGRGVSHFQTCVDAGRF